MIRLLIELAFIVVSSAHIVELTDSTFSREINIKPNVLVIFYDEDDTVWRKFGRDFELAAEKLSE